MNEEQKLALEAVDAINQELFDKYDALNEKDAYKDWLSIMPTLSVTIAGGYTFIGLSLASEYGELPEIHLYNSENNDLIYYEENDSYELFYDYIKRKFAEIKEEIYSIVI